MNWKKRLFNNWKLYVIIDRQACQSEDISLLTKKAILGGADIIQLRDKISSAREFLVCAKRLKKLCSSYRIPFVVNDRVDIARIVDAEGVHVGQDDITVHDARLVMGPKKIIGKSTHCEKQALCAQKEEVDYIGVGPVFATPTKPDYPYTGLPFVKWATSHVAIPWVAIGGIDLNTIDAVVEAGACTVAVVRAVCSVHNPQESARQLKKRILNPGFAIGMELDPIAKSGLKGKTC